MRAVRLLRCVVVWIALCFAGAQGALGAPDDLGSCYDMVQIPGVPPERPSRQLYVLVDQTVVFNSDIQSEVNNKIQQFLSPGDRIVLLTFSAYARGRYPDVLLKAVVDRPLSASQRSFMWRQKLNQLDQCMAQQTVAVRAAVSRDLGAAFGNASEQLPYTELLSTLHLLSEQMAKETAPSKRYLLIVSDMQEYSSVANFYSGGHLRLIDPDREIENARKGSQLSDFGGTRVYVIGAGYSSKADYIPAKNIEMLENFWRLYFQLSHATLEGFGTPSLVHPLGQ